MRWERLNLITRARETLEGKKSPGRKGGTLGPGKRWGHTCNSVKGGKYLYVFGGYGKDNCQTNDVHVFDTTKKTWSKPVMKGIPPSPRDSHSCTTVGNNLFVFGGTDGKDPLNDLHILDTSSNTWISPSLRGEGPGAREGHSAAHIGKRLFIFGGCGKSHNNSDEVYYNDLYILDTENLVWRRAITSGSPPSPRDSHSCSSWRNKIIVIAGEDASDSYLSDVHILDADTLVWRELSTSGQILPPRAGHSTVALSKHLFVFGGFTDDRNLYDDLHMLNLDTRIWTKVMATGQGPSARFSVAGDSLDQMKGILVFIGGCNEHLEALDDMYYLHTDMLMENGQDGHKAEKFSLKKELKRKCQEQYLPASLSVNDKDVPKLGKMPDTCRTMPLSCYSQAANKKNSTSYEFVPTQGNIFEAKVTEAFHYGYTIETNINGKRLRGILFSYKPGFAHEVNTYLSRKSTADEVGGIKLNDDHKSELETTSRRHVQQEPIGHTQADSIHGKESTSQESPMETTTSDLNNSPPVGVSKPPMIIENSEQSALPLPDSKDVTNNPPDSSTEVSCENRAATTKDIVSSSLNQDGPAPGTREA